MRGGSGGSPSRGPSLPDSAGDGRHWFWSLSQHDPLEEAMAGRCSTPAWRIPRAEEPGGLQSTGSRRVRHHWSDWTVKGQGRLLGPASEAFVSSQPWTIAWGRWGQSESISSDRALDQSPFWTLSGVMLQTERNHSAPGSPCSPGPLRAPRVSRCGALVAAQMPPSDRDVRLSVLTAESAALSLSPWRGLHQELEDQVPWTLRSSKPCFCLKMTVSVL